MMRSWIAQDRECRATVWDKQIKIKSLLTHSQTSPGHRWMAHKKIFEDRNFFVSLSLHAHCSLLDFLALFFITYSLQLGNVCSIQCLSSVLKLHSFFLRRHSMGTCCLCVPARPWRCRARSLEQSPYPLSRASSACPPTCPPQSAGCCLLGCTCSRKSDPWNQRWMAVSSRARCCRRRKRPTRSGKRRTLTAPRTCPPQQIPAAHAPGEIFAPAARQAGLGATQQGARPQILICEALQCNQRRSARVHHGGFETLLLATPPGPWALRKTGQSRHARGWRAALHRVCHREQDCRPWAAVGLGESARRAQGLPWEGPSWTQRKTPTPENLLPWLQTALNLHWRHASEGLFVLEEDVVTWDRGQANSVEFGDSAKTRQEWLFFKKW